MSYLIVFLIGLLGASVQTTLLDALLPAFCLPDPLLLLVIYLSLFFPFGRGMLMSFALGLFGDLLSGAPQGMNALFFIVVFVLNKGVQARVFVKRSRSAYALFFLDFGLKLPYLMMLVVLFGYPFPHARDTGVLWLGETVASLALMPFLLPLLSRVLGSQGSRVQLAPKSHTA